MRKFDENDYNSLSKFEDKMKSAIDSKYVSGLTQEARDTFSKIYSEVMGRKANVSCSGCVLQMLSMVGNTYFTYKQNKEEAKKNARSKKTIKDKPGTDIEGKSDNIDA